MVNIIAERIYLDPIREAISKTSFNKYFGEQPEFNEGVEKNILIYAKMAFLSVNLELEKYLPGFYSIKESFKYDLSFTDDDVNKLYDIKYTDDVKTEYFDNLIMTLNSIIDEYKLLKDENKIDCKKEKIIKFRDLIQKYMRIIGEINKPEPVKNKGGRPKLSDDMKRKNKIILYFTDDELNDIKIKSGKTPISTYIKNKIL